jgi:hypothetical protein
MLWLRGDPSTYRSVAPLEECPNKRSEELCARGTTQCQMSVPFRRRTRGNTLSRRPPATAYDAEVQSMARGRIIFFFVASIVVFCSSSGRAYGQVYGERELLRLIQTGYTTNFEKISTWRGRARVSVNSLEGDSVRRTMAIDADFVHDASFGATRWSWRLLEDVATLRDGTESRKAPYFKNCMFKDKKFYKFGPFTPTEQQRPYWLVVSPPNRSAISNFSENFDPLLYLRPPSLDIQNDFPLYYAADATFRNPFYISREGSLIIFERVNRLDETWRSRYVFDISQGCNLVHYESRFKDSKTTTADYEYQNIDGVFVPQKVIHCVEVRGDHPESYRQETVFLENTVNKLIAASEFELAKLGLLPGDTINDKILGVVFKYRTMDSRALDVLAEAARRDELALDYTTGSQDVADTPPQENHDIGPAQPSEEQRQDVGPGTALALQTHIEDPQSYLRSPWLWILVVASVLVGLVVTRMLTKRGSDGSARQ